MSYLRKSMMIFACANICSLQGCADHPVLTLGFPPSPQRPATELLAIENTEIQKLYAVEIPSKWMYPEPLPEDVTVRMSALVYSGALEENGLVEGPLGQPQAVNGPLRYDYHAFALEVRGGVAGEWQPLPQERFGEDGVSERLEPHRLRVPWRALSSGSGESHTCLSSERSDVYCWGTSEMGQLGDLTAALHGPRRMEGLSDVEEIALGTRHTCLRKTDGRVFCFGDNRFGQLGRPGFESPSDPLPTEVPGVVDAVQVSASHNLTCARDRDGAVTCWGSHDIERVTGGVVAFPVPIEKMSVGSFSVCGLAGGEVYCAGRVGPEGTGSPCQGPNMQEVPVKLSLGKPVIDIGLGDAFSCALLDSNELRCWGCNDQGQMGNEMRAPHMSPIPVLPRVRAFELGHVSGCAILLDEKVVCWGDNTFGQLGAGLVEPDPHTPIEVVGLGTVRDLDVYWNHACAIRTDGNVACWGDGRQGQLGNGVSGNAIAPVVVDFP